ncbi:MAG: tetratricopeptide repeat protein [Acidobacteria bacterium]|nr:MAG: tetratricopeptide repeat protein [Acidobacteriota bacterium]
MTNQEDQLVLEFPYELLRDIYLNRKTGVLELPGDEEPERMVFISGDLYVPADHPLRDLAELWAILKARDEAPSTEGDQPSVDDGDWTPPPDADHESLSLTGVLVDRLFAADRDKVVFEKQSARVSPELVGPLPMSKLVMDCSVHGSDEFQLLRQLGGEDRRYQALPGAQSPDQLPRLDPQEAFLLSRLEQPTAIRELLAQMDLGRLETLSKLCRLQAVDLIRPEEDAPSAQDKEFLSAEIIRKFSDRIAKSLEQEPLEMSPVAHRELLSDLLSRLGELNFFELLRVELGSTSEEIQEAFVELGRIVHPGHATDLGLKGKEAGMQMLFEKATEAYLTLSDPERSRLYCLEVGPVMSSRRVSYDSKVRREEEVDSARHNFNIAKGLVWQQQLHSAIQLLEQAVKIDPQAEYFALLGQCQAENPNWVEKAVQSYHHAARLRPDDPELHATLGSLLERTGQLTQARREYEAALKLIPGFPEAEEGLARLGPSREDTPKEVKGVLRRLFGRRKD